jgi:NADPH2:quinone reductase
MRNSYSEGTPLITGASTGMATEQSKHLGEIIMRAMRAESFTGYKGLKLVEAPRPRRADGRVLVRITAAGVTPLDHTILSGGYPRAKAPLILGNEGAGVVEDPGDSEFPVGARVMFTGLYGVSEDGTYSEWIAVRKEDLCLIPDNIDDASAGGIPVAYLTAQIALNQAGFEPGKTVLAPAIGGSVGNAVTQLARAQGAGKAISTTTNPAKARQARALGFDDVIDLSAESLVDAVARITAGRGVDIVIDGIGALAGQALATLAPHGVLISLGYSGGRQTTINVTDLIWKQASMRGLNLFAVSPALRAAAWATILSLLSSAQVKPIVERTYKLADAAEALRHLIEDRPFGRVVLVP